MSDYEHLRELAEKATPGPWHWTPDRGNERFASDCGPNLENSAEDLVLGAWGHDWWGITVDDADAAFIAAANPDAVLNLLEDLRLTRQERDQEKHKNLALSKDNALLHRALEAVEGYVGRLEHEREALRRANTQEKK